jgi:all-trans-retinol 13,14-reductase
MGGKSTFFQLCFIKIRHDTHLSHIGLSSAALLSKAGLKVLVLEKHGKCGGACHIFKAEGYEFDVGIHYIGGFTRQTLDRTLLDQISDGQIQWAQLGMSPTTLKSIHIYFNLCLIRVLENNFDRVIVDVMSPTQREYSIPSGRGVWKNQLIERFPEERKAIETFFSMVNKVSRQTKGWIMVKVLPIWLVNLISLFGLPRFLSDFYSLGSRTLNDVIQVIILSSCIAFKLKPYHILFILAFLIILELN